VAPVVQIAPASLPPSVLKQADDFRKARAAAETTRLAAQARLKALERDMREAGSKHVTAQQRHERRVLVRAGKVAPPVAVPPPPADAGKLTDLYRRLGSVIGMSARAIHARVVQGIADTPYSNVTVKTLTGDRAAFNYLLERKDMFPGVVVEKRFLREYPYKQLAAQLFGTVNEISPDQLKLRPYKGIRPGTRIGQTGLEARYDRYLRGTDGYTKIVVNSTGNRDQQTRTSRIDPKQGQRVQLTLDLGLQQAADAAMRKAMGWATATGAHAGAYVAMDPTNGAVLALGSYPSFDANVLAKPISQRTYDALTSDSTGAPLLNRAIASGYPTGSTFKPVTAMATLESGIATASQTFNDTGTYKLGTQTYQNAKKASFGVIDMVQALKVSSDIFFYDLGARADPHGRIIQDWARKLGLGRRTGIDLPGESAGLVPDAAWRNAGYAKYQRCVKKAGLHEGTSQALYACGGIEKPWTPGDNVNLAVGQGDLQATPLQLATAYSTIVNGGTVVRPHLGAAIEDGNGRLVEQLRVPKRGTVSFSSANRDTIMAGLHAAATEHGGTSADIFSGFPYPVYGKTGTAERGIQPDQSWYAIYVDNPKKPIVVVTTIERGGFGAETAAPAACLILNKWFHLKRACTPGSNQSR
jgi:penicillin-binding protein 2